MAEPAVPWTPSEFALSDLSREGGKGGPRKVPANDRFRSRKCKQSLSDDGDFTYRHQCFRAPVRSTGQPP